MNKKALLFIVPVCLAVLTVVVWKTFLRSASPAGAASGDVGKDLQARVAALPKPALTNLPRLAPAATRVGASASPAAKPAPLSEEMLAPLRRAFVPVRFTEDPKFPRGRQTLLSNRLLVSPEKRTFPQTASGVQSPTARNTTPFIVQFNTAVTDASRTLLADAGAIIRGFFPNNALLAELTPSALASLNRLSSVQAAAEYLPDDKLQPFLASLVASQPPETRVRMTLQTLAPEDAKPVSAAVGAAGGEVEGVNAGTRWGTVQAVMPLSAVKTLVSRGDVQWIEERPLVQKRNDSAGRPSHLNTTNAWATWGLTGKGQVVGHADTGLDTGVLATMHPDFQGRIRALIARGRAGDASDPHGHGTHTAGSILGSGAASSGQYRGMAYEAELVHQSVGDAYGNLVGLGSDLYSLFVESYSNGACIHSDSWGSSTYGTYDNDCRSADLFAWDHPDHLAVFAAGNDGRDSDLNGVVDTGAVGSPATAKNVLCVGATENDRAPGTGGYSSKLWYAFRDNFSPYTRWYPVAPLSNDYVSYSATLSPYRQGMAAFSSRGPTEDNRIKPDVVAPGTDVISTQSSVGDAVWASLSSNSRYCFGGGTSMATPLTAGTAALLRQYAIERGGVTNPTAALLKAMLVGGARSLAPGQYGTNATQEIPSASPNNVEGWGQPDIAATVHPSGSMVRLFDRIGPAAGMTNTIDVTVTTGNTPLDIALCWIDYPATAGAGVTCVNDLDLLVIAPDGTPLYPNGGLSRDAANTVETVRLTSAQAGLYRVCVIGAAVPYSGGAAALYVRGAVDASPVIVHAPLAAQIAGFTPYPVSFQVQSLAPFTQGEARLFWTTGTSSAPTGTWQSAAAAWITNATYQTEIPNQIPATHVYYYLQIDDGAQSVRLPQAAPDDVFSFYVDVAVALVIEGTPARFGTVTPPYGTNTQITGVPFGVSAPSVVPISTGLRRVCAGWNGSGDVPTQGTTNDATLVISQPSTLTWVWNAECALTSRYRLANTGQLFGESVSWHPQNLPASTETALELGFVGSTPYAFCGWYIDGARWPDATSPAPNPATGIPMPSPRLAQGDYLPFWQDTDGNTLSDWWETRYFGSSTNDSVQASDDPDNDNWTNLAEFLDNTDPKNADSVPTPPAIAVSPLAAFQAARCPWIVTATVTDNMTVEQVFLVWRENGDTAWQNTAMTWVEGDTYQAELDPPTHGAKRVDYYVAAYDLIGYYFPDYGSVSPTYSVIGDYATPWMHVTPQTFDAFELTVETTNIALTVANLAGPDLVWTARVAAASAPFAATNAAWSHGGLNDAWCVTTNRTWNGDAVWYCGSAASRTYPDGCHARLDTPPFTVGAGGGLLFRQWIKTEYDAGTHYWDGAVIRVSSDGGATFTLIEPTHGYPALITDNPDSPFAADQPCLAGDGGGWETLLLDLAGYAGQNVIVRFEFGSDLYISDEGWYVANVTPFSYDAPLPAWLIAQGPWGGTLPDTWTAPVGAVIDPSALAFDEEAVACIRFDSNDSSASTVIPLTVRRGHRLFITANGPGSASADRTFLFRNLRATVTMQAEQGTYLYCVTVNGVPQPGIYDYTTTRKTLVFNNLSADQHVAAWFASRVWQLTVASLYSASTPAVGTYSFTNKTAISASVISPVPIGRSIRRECRGWTLTGHAPSSGSTAQLTFALTNDATLTWNWGVSHLLTARADSNGTVAPTGGWYSAGEAVVVTAYPSLYYHLNSWIGDILFAGFDGDRITLVMDEPRTVTATFAPNLTATRGVPEYWLAAHGWTGDFESAAENDTDHDGMAAWAEWRADTDPTNGRSLLAISSLRQTPTNGVSLAWVGGVLRTQQVQRADSPAGPWISVLTNLPPTPVSNAIALPANGSTGFYRVHIE